MSLAAAIGDVMPPPLSAWAWAVPVNPGTPLDVHAAIISATIPSIVDHAAAQGRRVVSYKPIATYHRGVIDRGPDTPPADAWRFTVVTVPL